MKTSMLRDVSTSSATTVKERARGEVDADAGRAGGSSLAQLESVLQRLSKHEHRTHIESIERTSAHTQQQLLKDRLLQVQEELAKAQGDKVSLCEKLGALQQAKDGQQSEIDHLMVELRSSRESHGVMAKKVAQLENETLDLKRHYIRSVACRTKTASELLARLNISGALQDSADVSKTVATACNVWNGENQNKRKRVEDKPEPVSVEVIEIDTDEVMDEEPSVPPVEVTVPQVSNKPEAHVQEEVGTSASTSTLTNEMEVEHPRECQSCMELAKENEVLQKHAQEERLQANSRLAEVKDQLDALVQVHGQVEDKISAMTRLLSEKENIIEQLKADLVVERQQAEEARLASISAKDEDMKEKDASGDTNDRAKVLEENLAQLNTYADHLEMLISQCASCAVKLQSEGTQDLSGK